MLEKANIQLIKQNLFQQPETNVYAVLDGASVPDLPQVLWEQEPQYVCLYRGELKPDMAEVAPYLIKLECESPFTDWVIGQGWGNHWGIFALTPADVTLRVMRQHFRKFLMVLDPEGERIYFRYYDPRVLRVYLPTCNTEEIGTLLGPSHSYVLEDDDAAVLLKLTAVDGKLAVGKTTLS
jgi:hypothetical protein